MELYTFTGIADSKSILRVKADRAVELLPGFHRILEEMSDCNTVHAFTLTEKIKEEQKGGYFYTWYGIENYSRTVDNTALQARLEKMNANLDYVAMMTDVEIPEAEEGGTENAQPEI